MSRIGLGALTLQQHTEEASCCAPVATGLKENTDHVAVLVDCTPKTAAYGAPAGDLTT